MHIYILIRIQADAAQKERDAINEAKSVVERQRKRKIIAAKKKATNHNTSRISREDPTTSTDQNDDQYIQLTVYVQTMCTELD